MPFSIADKITATYIWFKSTLLGYPVRKLEKAIPDLILGLRHDDSRKPISRNVTVIASAGIGYLLGILTPLVFAPKLMEPLIVFTKSVLHPLGIHVMGGALAGVGTFILASVFATVSVYVAKYLYGQLFSRNTSEGHITNLGMVIPERRKTNLAKELESQIHLDKPRARFGVSELNSYATAIQERYVKFRDLTNKFDSNPHARLIAAESHISTHAAARAELAKIKEAMDNLQSGNWPAVKFYVEGLDAERNRQREYYESQRQRIEAIQHHLQLSEASSPSTTSHTLAEEAPLRIMQDLSHLNRDESAKLLRLEIEQIVSSDSPRSQRFFKWGSSNKAVIPLADAEIDRSAVEKAKLSLSKKIHDCQGPALKLPSLNP